MSCTTSTTSTILEHCAPSHINNKKKTTTIQSKLSCAALKCEHPHLPQFTKYIRNSRFSTVCSIWRLWKRQIQEPAQWVSMAIKMALAHKRIFCKINRMALMAAVLLMAALMNTVLVYRRWPVEAPSGIDLSGKFHRNSSFCSS